MEPRASISDCASQIRDLVANREYEEAVRRFEVLVGQMAPRTRHEVAASIIRTRGAESGEALAKAFARAPCYFCCRGQMTCDLCGGAKTFLANGKFCEPCAGHGRVLCTFCGGSGFLPLDVVPTILTETVVKRRLKWATRCVREVVGASAQLDRAGQTARTLEGLLRLFNAICRATAILDDVEPFVLRNEYRYGGNSQDSRARRLVAECRRVSDQYYHDLAASVAAFCSRQAEGQQMGSPRRVAWERQSTFYKAEAGSDSAHHRAVRGRPNDQ